jgi:hypothetical protein
MLVVRSSAALTRGAPSRKLWFVVLNMGCDRVRNKISEPGKRRKENIGVGA